jgi:hypothetical protein
MDNQFPREVGMQFQSTESWWPFLVPRPAGSVDVIGFLALGGLFTAHIRTVGLRPDRIRCIAHDHHNFEEGMYGVTIAKTRNW